jgi:2-polyprenyl-3-methyl-5-hydroxy-6-metoxy-1,4-benzoquinol methylase
MLAPRYFGSEYEEWNRRWGAPYGYPGAARIRSLNDLPLVHRARLAGPFAFQANNTTRYFEYPWVYDQIDHTRPKTIVDVGAGITGLQFVFAKAGHQVYCVDPGLASRDAYGWGSENVSHQDLNSAFHTSVIPVPMKLEDTDFSPGTIDYVTCVSTMEHVTFGGSVNLIKAAAKALRVGGQLVATVDLFIDLKPFTKRTSNGWGSNLNLGKLFMAEEQFKLVAGDPAQLYGCEGFDAKQIQERCAEFYLGEYPCFAQCFVLEKTSD